MDDAGDVMQNKRWAIFAGAIAALYFLNKLRKRRKMKKMIEGRLKARIEEQREKSVSGKMQRRLVEESKTSKKSRRKRKKERSMLSTIMRAVVFQLVKKIITDQINQADMGRLKGLKLGKKQAEEVA
ncbi:MAG: hypothetical protein A2V52_07690 [Actinobacteria bacterium RBG_19FT_COMBO_54_7]|uniref:Transmembrane protein n=1 Tax=Candidatus Solincola sediminis TaxID=1797199 RepID=A0A1F2WK81_9ACTN|nr:MAG: hypothetical protein A2Y75_07515 [Candidatus Solincola sediminis]OFW58831.1 MAG: hypothetical protein A2W01_01810 [Candidatus Solincola sediminis]OFW66497.1 MAG: hypothetical protein A2V52_07690 [Actinobacteria bacterium RBG_19FT_COMBO_54_7]